jgi:RNA polymerase sigma-70 factor, ECF subfamily
VTDSADPAALEAEIHAACDAGDWERAATAAIDGYGDELFRFLLSLARDQGTADDAFSLLCENVWVALPRFRWESSFRTWAYALARNAWYRVLRDPHRRAERRIALSAAPSLERAAAAVRSRTATFLRTESRDRFARLRAELDPDDQALLILRVGRNLSWTEIARALADPDEVLAAPDLERRAAALRKRFQRIKDELRAKIEAAGGGEPE